MKPFTLALRAIGSQLAIRLYIPTIIGVLFAMLLLVASVLWLTTLSNWWWLLMIPITSIFCIVLAVAIILFLLIRFVRPEQTKTQKQSVKKFVDRLQNIAEITSTPKLVILFRVIRSISAPSKESYLADLVSNRELANEFRDLQRSFDR